MPVRPKKVDIDKPTGFTKRRLRRWARHIHNLEVSGDEPGLCVQCGNQCVLDGSLAIICPSCLEETH